MRSTFGDIFSHKSQQGCKIIFQPQQNENRSPSPVPANPLFKKCSVADMSPGVSLFLRFRQDFHGFMFVKLYF